MGSLERRLTKLEGGRGRSCEMCGPDDLSNVEVTWDEPGEDQDTGPEHSPECGRRLVHIITWHDDDQGGGVA